MNIMNSVQISSPNNLFEVLQAASREFSRNYKGVPFFFNDSLELENNKTLGSNLSLFGVNYD